MAYDLSLPVSDETAVFPGYPPFETKQLSSFADGGIQSWWFGMSSHLGTHIDSPFHAHPDGDPVDALDPDLFCGPAHVVDLTHLRGERIDADDLAEAMPPLDGVGRVLLLTGDVDESFDDPDFFEVSATLTVDAAEWLADSDVTLIGNDFLTEAVPGDPDRPVHKTILGADIPIVEYLCNVDRILGYDRVEFVALPLALAGFEATPTRAVAWAPDG